VPVRIVAFSINTVGLAGGWYVEGYGSAIAGPHREADSSARTSLCGCRIIGVARSGKERILANAEPGCPLRYHRPKQEFEMQELLESAAFLGWIENSLERGENIMAVSNQGTLLHYRGDGQDLVVKAAMGRGLLRSLRERTLQREYQAYLRLAGVEGVPACHGMVAGHYLVIQHIAGVPYRQAEWHDRERWFDEFLVVLRNIHARGVSHGDLKSKGNILVTADQKPCVIDFGTSFIQRAGFHPVNNRLFEHARRMDLNAWVKHKYHGRYENMSEADLAMLDYSFMEYWVRKLRGRPTAHIPR
jgi:predicted Ser/Thr protein kinase